MRVRCVPIAERAMRMRWCRRRFRFGEFIACNLVAFASAKRRVCVCVRAFCAFNFWTFLSLIIAISRYNTWTHTIFVRYAQQRHRWNEDEHYILRMIAFPRKHRPFFFSRTPCRAQRTTVSDDELTNFLAICEYRRVYYVAIAFATAVNDVNDTHNGQLETRVPSIFGADFFHSHFVGALLVASFSFVDGGGAHWWIPTKI